MNKIRVYTTEEIKKLMSNSNVQCIRNKSQIVYKDEFKLWAVKEKLKFPEKTSREIFEIGNFDMTILDDRTPQKRLCSWVKKYKMFGEDYFTDKNKYSYKALSKENNSSKKCYEDPSFIAYIVERKDDGSLEHRIIKRLENEKDNGKS